MFYHCHPNIYVFLEAINEIQTHSYLKMNCSRTIRNNKTSTEKQHLLEQQIRYYEENEINRLEYVESISFKFVPKEF